MSLPNLPAGWSSAAPLVASSKPNLRRKQWGYVGSSRASQIPGSAGSELNYSAESYLRYG